LDADGQRIKRDWRNSPSTKRLLTQIFNSKFLGGIQLRNSDRPDFLNLVYTYLKFIKTALCNYEFHKGTAGLNYCKAVPEFKYCGTIY
jgi:hypothetical protein